MAHLTTLNSLDDNPTFAIKIFSELLIFMTIHKTISYLLHGATSIWYLYTIEFKVSLKY